MAHLMNRKISTKVWEQGDLVAEGLLQQCFRYGLGTKYWMMWAAGLLAAMSQLTYPSISAFVSIQSDRDKQGTVQGVVTGIRGLCQGLLCFRKCPPALLSVLVDLKKCNRIEVF